MKYLMWLLKAAIFFTLFAFALNNQQTVSVRLFFGTVWNAPLVLVVLATFACGLALGVLMMMPRWWRNRKGGVQHSRFAPASTMLDDPGTSTHHGI
ncbi:MAG: LapA family protein [Polaromonas sp.]|nr:LapA family protein [Polaromonas sp.]